MADDPAPEADSNAAIQRMKEIADAVIDIEPDDFKQIIDNLPSALMIVDEKGKILLVNHQLELLFGYTRTVLLGKKFDMLIPDTYRDKHGKHFAGYMQFPSVRPMNPTNHFSGRRRDGTEVPLQISLGPIVSTRGIWAMAVIRPRTDA